MMQTQLRCGDQILPLNRPQVMGILNVTPDSFSDGGRFVQLDAALRQAEYMQSDGASIIDVGGESTRPGAEQVSLQQELDRVVPVIEAIRAELPVIVSIDTSKPEVMRAAVSAGAGMINDVYALRQPGALAMAAQLAVPVCLMHMQGEPGTMQADPRYGDVLADVQAFLRARIDDAVAAGVALDHILIDPGFGFGKQLQHNLSLLRDLAVLQSLQRPLLVGLSRKRMLGEMTGAATEQRLVASVAAALLAVQRGAMILRVHDVKATCDALAVQQAVESLVERGND